MKYPKLRRNTVQAFQRLARLWNVGTTARATDGILKAWTKGVEIPQEWESKREAYLDRYTGQMERQGIPLWIEIDGCMYPSPKHLGMIMWGYSPDTARLSNVKIRVKKLGDKGIYELPRKP